MQFRPCIDIHNGLSEAVLEDPYRKTLFLKKMLHIMHYFIRRIRLKADI